MLKRDEFNSIEVTNERETPKVEFGKTQKAEFSSQRENKLPEGELNEKYIGKTIKKQTEVNVDYVNKVQTHATQTVVTSATTATSAASAVAATAVAASTVAVVAIATATGISVVLHDYYCELTSLLITSDSITYQMTIIDNKRPDGSNYQSFNNEQEPKGLRGYLAGDPEVDNPEAIYDSDRPFVLRIANDNYVSEHYLDYGTSNYGSFSGLTLGEQYRITLSENRFGGEVLYDEAFTTHKNSFMRDFYLSGSANYRNGTFDVYLDYLDELDVLSDFVLTLKDQEKTALEYSFNLQKINGSQEVSIFNEDQSTADFSFESTYDYTFSYKKSGEVYEFTTGSVSFYRTDSEQSIVYGVNWDKSANFLKRTISFSLNFVDDYNIFSNFKFILQVNSAAYQMEPLEFELQKTTEEQSVSLMDYPSFDFSESYNYMFTYMEEGEDIEQIADSGVVTMSDNSEAISSVTGVNWDKKANFITREFNVQLDFRDDYGYFNNFSLTLADHEYPEEVSEEFSLTKTTEVQTIKLNEDSSINFRRAYDYTFRYENRGVSEIIDFGIVTFTDNSGGEKEFNSFTINNKPNFDDNTFSVQLDYVDDLGELSSFTLTLTYPGEDEITIYLDATTEEQTISAKTDWYEINFIRTYSYSLTYWDEEVSDYVNADSGSLSFDMSDAVSQFNEFIFDETGDFSDESYILQLDYIDQLNIYTDFIFTIEVDGGNYSKTIHLDHTTEPQVQKLNEQGDSADSAADMVNDMFTYSFKYYDESISDYVEVISSTFTFMPRMNEIFTGIASSFDFTEEDGGQSYLLPIKFDFQDSGYFITGFSVSIYKNDQELSSLRFEGETYTTEWMFAVLVTDGFNIQDIIEASGVEIAVDAWMNIEEYPNMPNSMTVYREPATFTVGKTKEIYGGYVRSDYINLYSTLDLSIVYSGSMYDYECQVLLESYTGTVYEYNVTFGSAGYIYINLQYPDGDAIPSEDTFEDEFTDHPMKVSLKYRTRSVTVSAGDTSGPQMMETWSDYQTLVLYDSYQFYLSV